MSTEILESYINGNMMLSINPSAYGRSGFGGTDKTVYLTYVIADRYGESRPVIVC